MHGERKPPGRKLVAADVEVAGERLATVQQRADRPGAMTAQGSGARAVIARFSAPVLRPARDSVRRLALASVIANAVLVCTGAAVRLSSSGLGCPDWPQCTQTSAVAAHSAGQTSLNTAIEFGNRLLTFPLAAIAALTFIACLRYQPDGRRRRDLVRLSAVLPGGVIAQAVAGGIVVLTRLNPVMVAAHFLLSAAILAAAVVLHARVGEGQGPARPLVRADLRVLAGLLAAATALMLTAGTVVTGTGPLAGTVIDSHGRRTTVPRFGFPLQDVTQLHADIGWFIGALAVALAIGLHFTGAPVRAARASRIVLAGLAVQGAVGYTQYFSHLPAGLVWVHVSMAAALWILILRLYLSTRERQPLPAAAVTLAGTAPAARDPDSQPTPATAPCKACRARITRAKSALPGVPPPLPLPSRPLGNCRKIPAVPTRRYGPEPSRAMTLSEGDTMTSDEPLREAPEPVAEAASAISGTQASAQPGEVGETGDPACWACLVCQECGAVISEGHRAGCPRVCEPVGQ